MSKANGNGRARDSKGRFIAGHSIGRPKGSKSERAQLLDNFSAYMRGHITQDQWDRIVDALIKTAVVPAGQNQITAATLLFNYAWGKPPDTIYLEDDSPTNIAINIWQGLQQLAPGPDEE
jgi:hypothetical protein